MSSELVASRDIQAFLDRISGTDTAGGDQRLKAITRRIVGDLFATIDEFDVNEDEFWTALNFLAAAAPEFGLYAAGLGFEHFIDIRMNIADKKTGIEGGTPRTIEGPLYVAGAPRSNGFARLDDDNEEGETLIMEGRVSDIHGTPIEGAIVDVWHANRLGNYSYFDKSQPDFNLRRQIVTGADGRYKFRSIVPSGYSVPPQGATDTLLKGLGRHGNRPGHIHFFVSAAGHRHLTTQINIEGDPFLHDDFAYATHDDLIPPVTVRTEPEAIRAEGLNEPFSHITFDFTLIPAASSSDEVLSSRARALAT